MFSKPINKSKVRKILVVSLTNIGDVILTFPVIDILLAEFPHAKVSVVIGPKAESLFDEHPDLEKVFVFHKKQPLPSTLSFIWKLRKQKFDMVVDLRNTVVPAFLGAKYRTAYVVKKDEKTHMKEKHLSHLKTVFDFDQMTAVKRTLFISPEEQKRIDHLLEDIKGFNFIAVAPGSASEGKQWPVERFAEVCDVLSTKHKVKIVFVGDENDRKVTQDVTKKMHGESLNLCGRTTLIQLAEVLKRSKLLIANDSASSHLASYLDIPVVTLFGPSNPFKYGPWGEDSFYIQKCELKEINDPTIESGTLIARISADEVKSFISTHLEDRHFV